MKTTAGFMTATAGFMTTTAGFMTPTGRLMTATARFMTATAALFAATAPFMTATGGLMTVRGRPACRGVGDRHGHAGRPGAAGYRRTALPPPPDPVRYARQLAHGRRAEPATGVPRVRKHDDVVRDLAHAADGPLDQIGQALEHADDLEAPARLGRPVVVACVRADLGAEEARLELSEVGAVKAEAFGPVNLGGFAAQRAEEQPVGV